MGEPREKTQEEIEQDIELEEEIVIEGVDWLD